MPIKVQTGLPAIRVLESENIFVMPEDVALRQDIRPLKIVILNLMPNKIETETQLLRLMGNSPLQVDVELLQMATHQSKNTSNIHLLNLKMSITGRSLPKLWSGARETSIQRCIYAGELRQAYITTTEYRSILWNISSAVFFSTEFSTRTTLL